MKNILKLTLPAVLFTLISGAVSAQQRVVEESIVYDDPTVARPGKWIFGAAIGGYYSNSNSSVSNSSGTEIPVTQQYAQPRAGIWAGYGDLSILFGYSKVKSTLGIPGNSKQEDGDIFSADLRYLVMPLSMKYFVPYVLGSYVQSDSTSTFSYVNSNGVRQTGTNKANGPGLGLGGIIPISEKYGLRVDAREYSLKTTGRSNLFSNLNSDADIRFREYTAAAYYNITENINIQIGGTSSYIVDRALTSSYGFNALIGYTFH